MTRWLYNSFGDPIAFVQKDNVFTVKGSFIGKLFPDLTVWNGEYIGELVEDDRLIYDVRKLHVDRKLPGVPSLPGFVGEPLFKGPMTLPQGYLDVEFPEHL